MSISRNQRTFENQLTEIECRVLSDLAANAGGMVVRGDILRRVWVQANSCGGGPVGNVVKDLRRKLGAIAENRTYIIDEPRVGYRLDRSDEVGC